MNADSCIRTGIDGHQTHGSLFIQNSDPVNVPLAILSVGLLSSQETDYAGQLQNEKLCCIGFDYFISWILLTVHTPMVQHRLKLLGQEPVFCKS